MSNQLSRATGISLNLNEGNLTLLSLGKGNSAMVDVRFNQESKLFLIEQVSGSGEDNSSIIRRVRTYLDSFLFKLGLALVSLSNPKAKFVVNELWFAKSCYCGVGAINV